VSHSEDILVIGGGVIGVCAAYYLTARGRPVTLVEQGEICAGCSYGNAGLIVPSHVIPLAAPGVLTRGLKWLLDAESPFFIKPRLDPALLAWLWRFRAACKEEAMQQAIPVLRDLSRASVSLYDELVTQEQLACNYEQNGMLILFRSPHGYREGLAEARLLQEYGLSLKALDAAELRAMEPAGHSRLIGGVFCQEDGLLDPALFTQQLAKRVQESGGLIRTGTEVLGFETSGQKIITVRTTRGDFYPQQVVLAAGAWSPGVIRDLRLNLPVQAAKGYSITVKRPEICPRFPLFLGETWVAVTPLESGLRFAGTLELAGFDLTINRRRVDAILRAASDYLTGLEELELIEIWRGLRPTTPDGLPIIGRSVSFENLILATGHAMLGVSLGPITGELVAQLAGEQTPTVDLTALRVERFG
jgi:D-amino-acid dehydrogenase